MDDSRLGRKTSRPASSARDAAAPPRRLLCATDLSERSLAAVERAAQLARLLDAALMLVHVVDERQPERLVRMVADRAAIDLRGQLESLSLPCELETGIAVRVGRVLPVIREAAQEWGADLLILAAPPRRHYERMLGTTAERIVRSVELPVLFVNREVDGAYGKALIATDLSAAAVRMTRASATLRLFVGADTTIVHAFGPPYEGMMSRVGVSEAQVQSYARRLRALLLHELNQHAAACGIVPARLSVVQESASPFRGINRVVKELKPDLVVIGTSRYFMLKRMLLGSVADEVLRNIDSDILVVSPAAATRSRFIRARAVQGDLDAGWHGRAGGTLGQMKGWEGAGLSAAAGPARTDP